MKINKEKLADAAIKASKNAYAPYSKYHVGAAVLCSSGKIYTGCNVENISYGLSNCAERTAIFKAISEGEREICALAFHTKDNSPCSPCGACLQVISEFAAPEIPVYQAKKNKNGKTEVIENQLNDFFPAPFTSKKLNKK